MSNPSIPLNIILNQKKSHYSNEYLEQRKVNEEKLKADDDKVTPPTWLSKNAKKQFKKIVIELKKIKLATNLDVNSLAVYADSVVKFIEFEAQLKNMNDLLKECDDIEDTIEKIKAKERIHKLIVNFTTKKLQLGDAIRKYSVEFGLTPQSRAKLAIPREKEKKKSEEEEMFNGV